MKHPGKNIIRTLRVRLRYLLALRAKVDRRWAPARRFPKILVFPIRISTAEIRGASRKTKRAISLCGDYRFQLPSTNAGSTG